MKHKFLFSVFIIFFIFVFIALGSWQIVRLNWKNNLILEIENSLKNPPVELTKSNKENFLKIRTSGTVDFEKRVDQEFYPLMIQIGAISGFSKLKSKHLHLSLIHI